MAEVRKLEFEIDNAHPDEILQATFNVPTVRSYVGIIRGDNGPAILVNGNWALTLSRTFKWVSKDDLPYTLVGDDVAIGMFSDSGFGVYSLAIET